MNINEIIEGAWHGACDLGYEGHALKLVIERAILAAATEGARTVNYGAAIPGTRLTDAQLRMMRLVVDIFPPSGGIKVDRVDIPGHATGRVMRPHLRVNCQDRAEADTLSHFIKGSIQGVRALLDQVDYLSGPIRDATMDGALDQYARGYNEASRLAKQMWQQQTRTLLSNLAAAVENRGMQLVNEGMAAIDLPETLAVFINETKL